MATQNQIHANRQNSLLSTGPTTALGKAVIAKNALKHGVFSKHILLNNESKHDFKALEDEFQEHFKPQGFLEKLFLERALTAAWRLSRITQMESTLISQAAKDHFEREGTIIDVLHYWGGDGLALLSRYETSLEKILLRSLSELRLLQASRNSSTTARIGFVPQNLIEDAIEDT